MIKKRKKVAPNQAERLWLAELEARMDAVERSDSRKAVSLIGNYARDFNSDDLPAFSEEDALALAEWLDEKPTFWQRLRWLIRGA